ncbi:GlxA family transcriptional regulator [Cumulibacter soli]|uniref:GlxA family transcriptional regulator n=1 Tax=Cumulibacter soli TaxID=2546344 RepID=UPI00106726FB|nr:DJ-1/PfpI family protein [Cumulibacter soli]
MNAHEVVFLVFDGMTQLDVAGPAEVFAEARRRGARYELRYVSPDGRTVDTSIGTRLEPDGPAADIARAGTVLVVGSDSLPTRPIPPELAEATRHLVGVADRVASVCTGAFLLAAVGALDGHRATTHWAHAARLATSHPRIEVDSDALFVHDGRVHTSAGVSAGIDLALSLVESDLGADLARDVAQQLVLFMRRPGGQSQFSAMLDISHGAQANVRLVVDAIIERPDTPWTVQDLAQLAGVSARHLSRLFVAQIGMTPVAFVEQTRLETAKSLLLRGESVTATARRCGFASPETMRRTFVRALGLPPRSYRQRFQVTEAMR